ncbi:PAS domain S-box protein, partial [Candidatus Curtissbacteria bacterium]|nr:PAS domain S-box protein [Candidatus Curtissbacteria bacterium]
MKGNYYPNFSLIDKVSLTKEAIPYDEHLHTSRDGKEIWVGVSKTPILNEEEEIEQIVGIIRDVTKLKEIEKAKSEFVSIASHELRTPLTIINGYLSLLLSGDLGQMGELRNKLYHLNIINKIYSETKRLSGLVEELLNVTRVEEGRLKIDLKRTDYNELLEEVVNEFRPIASSKQITLSLEKPSFYPKDLHIYVDRDRIKEVLVNLIDNSIKYTGKGGKILLFPSL